MFLDFGIPPLFSSGKPTHSNSPFNLIRGCLRRSNMDVQIHLFSLPQHIKPSILNNFRLVLREVLGMLGVELDGLGSGTWNGLWNGE